MVMKGRDDKENVVLTRSVFSHSPLLLFLHHDNVQPLITTITTMVTWNYVLQGDPVKSRVMKSVI